MKLCRFELASAPGFPRSGIVYSGKVYETDGTNPIAVHEWSDVHLLSPIGQPRSIRVFEPSTEPSFVYANSGCLVPPSAIVKTPTTDEVLSFVPSLAVIVATEGTNIVADSSEEHILGLSLAICLQLPSSNGRRYDAGLILGPAITTPDEIEEQADYIGSEKTYKLNVSVRINGEERMVWNVMELPITIGQALSYASQSTHVAPGDLLCLQPSGIEAIFTHLGRTLERGDEIQLVCDRLGAISTTLA